MVSQDSIQPLDTQQINELKPTEVKPRLPKWIIALTAVLVLVAIIGVWAYVTRNTAPKNQATESATVPAASPSPSVSWKTYTNTRYNFSISYPGNWTVKESDSKDGASFMSELSNDITDGIAVSWYIGRKSGGYDDTALAEYAKVAAIAEIQNYNTLASYKIITTDSGLNGYETTWMVQPIMGSSGKESESSPITYFAIPGDNVNLLRITLDKQANLSSYEKMLASVAFSKNTPVTSPVATKSATPAVPAVDGAETLKTTIKTLLDTKHNDPGSSLVVTVSQISGNYAKGGASDEGGGGMWFAAKVEGIWQLVWDGNGVILCSDLTAYPNFPASMIPECWNEATQNTVQR